MSKAQPMPRKYKSNIDEAQDNLRYIAKKAQLALEMLQAERHTTEQVYATLQEIKALAYEGALNLAEIEVAADCTTCPAAPPTTRYQNQLWVLADTLEQLALETRQSLGSRGKPPHSRNRQAVTYEIHEA